MKKEKILKKEWVICPSEDHSVNVDMARFRFNNYEDYIEFMKKEAISVSCYMVDGLETYDSYELTTHLENKEKHISSSYLCHWFVLRRDINSLKGFVKLENNQNDDTHLLKEFGVPYFRSGNGQTCVYKEKYDKVMSLLNTEQTPYVIKNTDWPYWFIVDGVKIKSKTSSWFKYLYDTHGYISDSFLEKYTGPDKESEHKDDK